MSTSAAPVPFIIGVPRSGTTLLRLMLDAHSQLAIPAETNLFPAITALLPLQGEKFRAAFLDALLKNPRWGDWRMDADSLKKALEESAVENLSDGIRTFFLFYSSRFHKKRWGDKTPLHLHYITSIREVLPETRFIHIIRNGRDVAVSLRKLWWGPGDDIAAHANYWKKWVLGAREQARQLEGYCEIFYEDLVRDPGQILQQICSDIHLPYESSMTRYYETAGERMNELTTVISAINSLEVPREDRIRIHEQTAMPAHPGRSGRWRQTLKTDEIAIYQDIAGDLLTELGYELD